MIDTLLADGLASGMGEKVATLVVKCLAVAGGFLVGYFVGGAVAWALDRWVFAQKAPEPVKKAVSIAAAIALAIVVALIVFGDGGGSLFGRGGGSGDGKGTPNPSENKGATTPPPAPEPKRNDITPKPVDPVPPSKPADTTVRVTILGGTDVPNNDERYYLVDDDTDAKTLAQLAEVVNARKQKAKGTIGLVIQFRSTNRPSLDPEHESITKLRKWASDAKVDVTFPAAR